MYSLNFKAPPLLLRREAGPGRGPSCARRGAFNRRQWPPAEVGEYLNTRQAAALPGVTVKGVEALAQGKRRTSTSTLAKPSARVLVVSRAVHGARTSETSYSAVLKHTDVAVVPLASDDDKHVFQARVVEAIRGPKQPSISYFMLTEKGEEAGFAKEPVIVTLCEGEDGYYWPGTGAEFPLTEASLAVARSAAQHLPQGQRSFRSCD